jgi:hypothetical protein
MTLQELCLREGIVAIFIKNDQFLEKAKGDDDGLDGTFLGYYEVNKVTIESNKKVLVAEEMRNDTASNKLRARFRERPHYKVSLEPLFRAEDLLMLHHHNEQANWSLGVLSSRKDDVLSWHLDQPINDALALDSEDGETFDTAVSKFISQNAFTELLDNAIDVDSNCSDDDDTWILTQPKEKTVLSNGLKDVLLVSSLVFCAGAMRYLEMNIIERGTKTLSTPLSQKEASFLGSALRAHSMPMPIRSYDAIPLLLRGVAAQLGLLKYDQKDRVSLPPLHVDWLDPDYGLVDMVFRAIVLRFTGRVSRFSCYWRDTSKISSITSFVPSREELPLFLNYMQKSGKSLLWISNQHKGSLPSRLIGNISMLSLFFQKTAVSIFDTMKKMLLTVNVAEATCLLKDMLCQAISETLGEENPTDVSFVAQQVMADTMEIFDDPFGPPVVDPILMFLGHGSRITLKMLPMEVTKNNQCLSTIRDMIIAYQKMDHGSTFLNTLGLETRNLSVVVKLNGRPINMIDSEHILCKTYIVVYKTIGERSISAKPVASTPDCHPIRMRCHVPWTDACVCDIMEEGIEGCKTLAKMRLCYLPEIFRLRGEKLEEKDDENKKLAASSEEGEDDVTTESED